MTSAQVGPEASSLQLKPADGMEATLFAAEPMVINPTNIDVDSRGRVWVAEGLNYRTTQGNRPFTRIEDADRIKILEDTDGDGKADKVTVFADHIYPIPMGLAVEEKYGPDGKYLGARVYVGNSPDLLVLEDTDGDDKADVRSVLLTGFGGIDSDHGVHGMTLGLDGKLYFTHGDGCCSFEAQDHSHRSRNFDVTDKSGRHVTSSNLANTLRVDRDGTNFEIIADRQRNNYETCNNAWGNGFTSDNDDDGNRGCRIIWVMDGGSYGYKTPGSPRHWGEEVPGNVPKMVGTGNGSPCGLMVYEGSLLPPEYRGGLLEAEAGTRRINFFPIERRGASFRTEIKALLTSDDPWFRPVDMTACPDGSIMVADWYDAGVGGHSFRDQTTGRIYRVAPKGHKTPIARPDYATIPGLIAQLSSPVVAAQDAARRSLIARKSDPEVGKALLAMQSGADPILKARALWVRHAIEGDAVAVTALKDADPRTREQAVRILGRDVSQVGSVTMPKGTPVPPPRALDHLAALQPLADDADPGVRRELILAFRRLPTSRVGTALKALARGWDGEDRWYLEALGLALGDREGIFLTELFDGSLFGPLDLDRDGQQEGVAVAPYFPSDRNEAFLSASAADRPANALSKSLGLAWRLHRPEALPMLRRIAPSLATVELQQAADDALTQFDDKEAAILLAQQALDAISPSRKVALMKLIARKINGPWADAKASAALIRLVETGLTTPATRSSAIDLAVAANDARYGPTLIGMARDLKQPEEVRLAAIEAVGQLRAPGAAEFLDGLIAAARKANASDPFAEAAVRALPRLRDSRTMLLGLIVPGGDGSTAPSGLRHQALRTFARGRDGARGVLNLAREGKLAEDLKGDATAILHESADPSVRAEGAKLLPPPKAASGRTLPTIAELTRRDGDADRGRAVFARANGSGGVACASCHRVQGEGRWIGPDLSTIGVKYGKDELFRSILYPSAAVGYSYKTNILALKDGRTVTGLVVEESPDRIVVKQADGRRESIRPGDVEDRKLSDLSLMPEGLAEAMTDRELVDLVSFLSTLRDPVSIVGQFQAVGPVAGISGSVSSKSPLGLPDGTVAKWRRADADAEGRVDLTTLAGTDGTQAAYLASPVVSPADLETRLVLDTGAEVTAWLDGKLLAIPAPEGDKPRIVPIRLSRGDHEFVVRVPGGGKGDSSLVATFVATRPLEFHAAGPELLPGR